MGKNEEGRRRECCINAKSMCKLGYLKSLALCAVSESPSVSSSLGAFFGHQLAATSEALCLRADPSLFVCQRCESILQAGHNCTVRIEKNISKPQYRRNNGCSISTQNKVVYKCHFCSHQNLMRGTPKSYVKEISTPKANPPLKSNLSKSVPEKKHTVSTIAEVSKVDNVTLRVKSGQDHETSLSESPSLQNGLSLLDAKKRKRNRSYGKKVSEVVSSTIAAEAETSVHGSSKRRRKPWKSLKEIAHRSEHDTGKKLTNFTIPFVV